MYCFGGKGDWTIPVVLEAVELLAKEASFRMAWHLGVVGYMGSRPVYLGAKF